MSTDLKKNKPFIPDIEEKAIIPRDENPFLFEKVL